MRERQMSEDAAALVAERARQVAGRTAGAANQEAAAQERERLLKRQVCRATTSISIIIT
jgi:hypothetical protein